MGGGEDGYAPSRRRCSGEPGSKQLENLKYGRRVHQVHERIPGAEVQAPCNLEAAPQCYIRFRRRESEPTTDLSAKDSF